MKKISDPTGSLFRLNVLWGKDPMGTPLWIETSEGDFEMGAIIDFSDIGLILKFNKDSGEVFVLVSGKGSGWIDLDDISIIRKNEK